MAAANTTPARLRELLYYDPESGLLVWRVARGPAKAGDVAGTIRNDGYVYIGIDGRLYYAHRLAWLWITGAWPTNHIDHIDGNKANNRFDNLREASRSENGQNQRKAYSSNHSCGLLGATWHKQRGKWQARIMIDGKRWHLGSFDTAELAHAAYLTEKRRLHPFGTI